MLLFFTAYPKDAGTCMVPTVPGPNQKDLSAVLQPFEQAAAGWGKEGMSAQSGRKGFSQQLFATLQGATEAAH